MTELKQLEAYSDKMIQVFVDSQVSYGIASDEQEGPTATYVSDKGLSELADIFNTVPIEWRAGVYSLFLDGLTARGIFYSIDQFQGTVH